MTVELDSGCLVSEVHEGDPECAGTLRIFRRFGPGDGAESLSLRILEFAPGLSPGICNENFDEVLYVMQGEGTVFLDGHAYAIEKDTSLFLRPGVTLTVESGSLSPLVMASSRCPESKDEATELVPAVTEPIRPDPPSPTPLVRLADQPRQDALDRWYRTLVTQEIGSEQVTQFVGAIPPGRAADHFHDHEEVLVVLNGRGFLWAGDSKTSIGPGSCAFLPRKLVHCVENTGQGALVLLGVFCPAGSPGISFQT